jgi:hypothetical protein
MSDGKEVEVIGMAGKVECNERSGDENKRVSKLVS